MWNIQLKGTWQDRLVRTQLQGNKILGLFLRFLNQDMIFHSNMANLNTYSFNIMVQLAKVFSFCNRLISKSRGLLYIRRPSKIIGGLSKHWGLTKYWEVSQKIEGVQMFWEVPKCALLCTWFLVTIGVQMGCKSVPQILAAKCSFLYKCGVRPYRTNFSSTVPYKWSIHCFL